MGDEQNLGIEKTLDFERNLSLLQTFEEEENNY